MKEQVLNFPCEGEHLVGILSEPEAHDCPAADVGVLIIVGGPQYRAGSHRQFTLLARHLASHGFASLRFDYRGMGDSGGEARDFLEIQADISAGIGALMSATPRLRRVVLWGLCDAASAALMYAHEQADTRLAGLVLANPWARSAQTLAATHVKHYYGRRVLQADFWLKLVRGGVGAAALTGAVRSLMLALRRRVTAPALSFQARMAAGLAQPRMPLQLLISTEDLTAREFTDMFPVGQLAHNGGLVDVQTIGGADHTFSQARHHHCVFDLTTGFLGRLLTKPLTTQTLVGGTIR
jgi:exosortase A-associated hydrolase 1